MIIFAGGIGENDTQTRQKILAGLEFLGVKTDIEKANIRGKEAIISAPDSKVKVLVVPTDEELVIAKDTYEIVIA
jgi:acetate kinase